MKRLLIMLCALSLLVVPLSAVAGDSSGKGYAKIYDSTSEYTITVKAYSGVVGEDARVELKIRTKKDGHWTSMSLAFDAHCEYGARDCTHWMKHGTAVDAGNKGGTGENTVYVDEIMGSQPDVKYEPWGVVVIDYFDGYYLLGYKMSKKAGRPYIEFTKVSQTNSRLSWKQSGDYTGE